MKYIGSRLSRQLLLITITIFGIVFISLGIVLPNSLLPFFEKNLYNYLSQPLYFIEEDTKSPSLDTEVAFIYHYDNTEVVSENFNKVIPFIDSEELVRHITNGYGNFNYLGKKYYYYKMENGTLSKIAITNDSYITKMRRETLYTIIPIMILTFALVAFILVGWSSVLVRKVSKLKTKIDHIDDDEFDHRVDDMKPEDELHSLALAIEDMRVSLKNQEEYRNQMYQNISHDFKTPLTVIKSYVEAVSDGVEKEDQALQVIAEQADKLEHKVHSLLYLNKLDYIKDYKNVELKPIDVTSLVNASVKNFKFHRKELEFIVSSDKDVFFMGTEDLWETVIDNLLANFMRYAEKVIKITIKPNKIIFYNDGPKIDKDLLEVIFVPFRKGMKGEFGLGLSIIKKSLNFMDYDITIKNHKKGVSFTITKGVRK